MYQLSYQHGALTIDMSVDFSMICKRKCKIHLIRFLKKKKRENIIKQLREWIISSFKYPDKAKIILILSFLVLLRTNILGVGRRYRC